MNYPVNCIRGIPNKDFIQDGIIGSHLFYFDAKHNREDGWCEQSINWQDNDDVNNFTLSQKKDDGNTQFQSGIAIIPKEEIDRLRNRPTISGLLSYERRQVENNPFHGNLLLKNDVPKHLMKQIAAGIALLITEHISNNN